VLELEREVAGGLDRPGHLVDVEQARLRGA
jgi:hypothetical protein